MGAGTLQILCAQIEHSLMDQIGAVIARAVEQRLFPRMEVSGDVGGLYEATIKNRWMTWALAGCTPLGKAIRIEVEVSHDDSWVPVVTISSTETNDPLHFIIAHDVIAATNSVLESLKRIIEQARSRSQYEREHLPELLQGKHEFTIYE